MKEKTSFPKDKIKILLLENIHPSAVECFNEAGYTNVKSLKSALTEEELIKAIADVHVLGIRSKSSITKKIIDKADKLWTLGCFCIGTNQVDLEHAQTQGVTVFNAPYSNTRSVAELVIGHLIHLFRRIPEKNSAAHIGEWLKEADNCHELRGKTLGIVGYGHIGSQVSVLAEAMGLKVIYYDVISKLAMGNAKPVSSLKKLLEQSDAVTLHVPETPETKNLISADHLKHFKQESILINLSRGQVVDLNALKESLDKGRIVGAAIDVFPEEPKSTKDKFTSILQGDMRVILTPHIGGSTEEAQENIGRDVAESIIQFLDNGTTVGSQTTPPLNLPMQHKATRYLHIHLNQPGMLSAVNKVMSDNQVNILGQYLQTNPQIGYVVLDVEGEESKQILKELKKIPGTIKARTLLGE